MSNKNTKYQPKHEEGKVVKIKKKKILRLRFLPFIISTCILLCVIAYACYQIYEWHLDNQKINKLSEELEEEVKLEVNYDEGELINPDADKNSDYWYYISFPFYEADFSTLLKKNNDTVAFIHMENTNINYPVVYSGDNKYYLTHAYDKSYNDAGWVFMDYRNNLETLSDNTVIYGHGRLNKTVFGSLKDALTDEWQQNRFNYVIWLSTPKENMMFQIFSIYSIQSESYYITTKFSSTNSKQQWLNTMKSRNTAPVDVPITVDDKVLTLSTCLNDNGGRVVVHAKLIKKQTR